MAKDHINAGEKPANEALRLPPGRILQQMLGTMAYDGHGNSLGIVGRDVPAQLVVQMLNGKIRQLTKSEAKAFKRWNRL